MKESNKMFRSLLVAGALGFASIANAHLMVHQPYVGLDGFYSSTGFKAGYGSSVMAGRTQFEGDAYVGANICEWWGLGFELGYADTLRRDRHRNFTSGDTTPGLAANTIAAGDVYKSTYKMTEWFLRVKGELPLWSDNFKALGAVGLSSASLKARYSLTRNTTSGNFSDAQVEARTSRFDVRKFVPTATVGLKWDLTQHFGVRALVTWKNTSKLRPKINNVGTNGNVRNSAEQLKMKDTVAYGGGVYYTF